MKTTNREVEVHSIQKHYQGKLFSFVKDEILEVVHYPFEQAIGMISDGRITDALTVLSLQKAWFYLFGMPKMR